MSDYYMRIINSNSAPLDSEVIPTGGNAIISDRSKDGVDAHSLDTSGLYKVNASDFAGLNLVDSLAVRNALELSKIQILDQIRKSLVRLPSSFGSFLTSAISNNQSLDNNSSDTNTSNPNTGSSSIVMSGLSEVAKSLNSTNDILTQGLEYQKQLADIEADRHKFESEAKTIRDLDGNVSASMSPRELEASKNASEARVATDTNGFELSMSDINDLFGDLPDIGELFKVPYASEIVKEYI